MDIHEPSVRSIDAVRPGSRGRSPCSLAPSPSCCAPTGTTVPRTHNPTHAVIHVPNLIAGLHVIVSFDVLPVGRIRADRPIRTSGGERRGRDGPPVVGR